MADTKQGREKKGLREAREAELRVLEADVEAMDDDADLRFYDEDDDVDPDDLVPYLVDDTRDATTIAADRTGSFDLPTDE